MNDQDQGNATSATDDVDVWAPFRPPPDEARLWRYIDLAKYFAMLTTRSLWFSRSDLLGDPFEGSITAATVAAQDKRFAGDMTDQIRETMAGTRRFLKSIVYVNCWHMSDHESAAMWKLYMVDHGIAIVSSGERLRRSLPPSKSLGIGCVDYKNYAVDVVDDRNLLAPFLHKRSSFEHEREVRAVVVGEPPPGTLGITVEAILDTLVESVRVAPTAPAWFFDVVVAVTRSLGFSFQISQSEMDGAPVF